MSGFVDLHCHWVAGIDDGARSFDEGVAILRNLRHVGFAHVVGTPHMRPGLFDNNASDLRTAFRRMTSRLPNGPEIPTLSLSSEHFFDAEFISRITNGNVLPYQQSEQNGTQSGGAILLEFQDLSPLFVVQRQLQRLKKMGYLPVIAHPERYRAVWSDPSIVLQLVDEGSVAQLDCCAVLGKYGSEPQQTARQLLSEGAYDLACSDAHRPRDALLTAEAIEAITQQVGPQERDSLLRVGPMALLEGRYPE